MSGSKAGSDAILDVSLVTVHAATGNQHILDRILFYGHLSDNSGTGVANKGVFAPFLELLVFYGIVVTVTMPRKVW